MATVFVEQYLCIARIKLGTVFGIIGTKFSFWKMERGGPKHRAKEAGGGQVTQTEKLYSKQRKNTAGQQGSKQD